MSSACYQGFGDRGRKRNVIESLWVEGVPPTIDTAIYISHDSSIRTPSLCWVRERLLSETVWLVPTMVQIRLLSMRRSLGTVSGYGASNRAGQQVCALQPPGQQRDVSDDNGV